MAHKKIDFLNNKELLRKLLKQADVMNTISGGRIDPVVIVKTNDDSLVISITAPSIALDAYNIILDGTQLTVIYTLKGTLSTALPMFTRVFEVPSIVDSNMIEGNYKGSTLTISLPYKNPDQPLKIIPKRSPE